TLFDELVRLGLRAYLDERQLPDSPRGFVAGLGAGIDHSPFLALILTTSSHNRPWVVKEVSEHMAVHGPFRVLNVLLDDVPLPRMNRTSQVIDGKHRDAARVAAELARRLQSLRALPAEDNRAELFHNDLAFTLAPVGTGRLTLTDPDGKTHEVALPGGSF